MSNIHNFTNRNLCEYQLIFPTVASLLDHLLFVIGNGYYFDNESGMIVDGGGVRIDEYLALSDSQWEELIAECCDKEREFAKQFASLYSDDVNEDRLAISCSRYKRWSVNDLDFSTRSLLADIHAVNAVRSLQDDYYRPYPLAERYSKIFKLNEKTPVWFIQIAQNFCDAWVMFLSDELENEHYWTSEEPESESEYNDLYWTTQHRDMLIKESNRLETLLQGTEIK